VTEGVRRDQVVDAAATSVVIPAHRADESFRACLASVAACRPPAGEVIVVADGEAPGCAALAAEHGARTLVTAGIEGPAVARNLGARAATGAVVLFLDADITVPADLVERVARVFAEEPGLDGVFGSYDAAPAARGVVSAFRNLLHHHVHQTSQPQAFSFWSGCGALRRRVLLESGGFDEGYRRPSVEDIELGARLVRDGHPIRLDRSLQVKHLKRWSLAAMVVADVRDRALPWTALILRERRLPCDLNLRHRYRLSTAAVVALVAALSATPALPRLGPAMAAACLLVLLAANLPFYRLLTAVRGPAFLAAAVPLHALHYFCGALGFAAGLARHLAAAWVLSRSRRTAPDAEGAAATNVTGGSETPQLAAADLVREP
jgi:hypothetical protein